MLETEQFTCISDICACQLRNLSSFCALLLLYFVYCFSFFLCFSHLNSIVRGWGHSEMTLWCWQDDKRFIWYFQRIYHSLGNILQFQLHAFTLARAQLHTSLCCFISTVLLALFSQPHTKSELKTHLFSSTYWFFFLFFFLSSHSANPSPVMHACVRVRACLLACLCLCVCVCEMKWVYSYVFVNAPGSWDGAP